LAESPPEHALQKLLRLLLLPLLLKLVLLVSFNQHSSAPVHEEHKLWLTNAAALAAAVAAENTPPPHLST
jgi:hypothetical protein